VDWDVGLGEWAALKELPPTDTELFVKTEECGQELKRFGDHVVGLAVLADLYTVEN